MSDRRRPNILWICTDQQRYDTIAALGNGRIRTPNIDRLVSTGVTFTRAYCQSTVCAEPGLVSHGTLSPHDRLPAERTNPPLLGAAH